MVNPETYTVSFGQLFHPFEIKRTKWPDVWRQAFGSYKERYTPAIFFDLELTNTASDSDTASEEVMNVLDPPYKRLRGMIPKLKGFTQLTEFFPFESELGYGVDERDFTAEARAKKLEELWEKAAKIKLKDRPQFRLLMVDMMLENLELNQEYVQLSKKARPYLESLRCQVFVAGQAYEAMPNLSSGYADLCGIRLIFGCFYPLDTGPLTSNIIRWPPNDSGQELALLMDPQKLATLAMRFILYDNHLGGVQR